MPLMIVRQRFLFLSSSTFLLVYREVTKVTAIGVGYFIDIVMRMV
jgi:hypothetical protein